MHATVKMKWLSSQPELLLLYSSSYTTSGVSSMSVKWHSFQIFLHCVTDAQQQQHQAQILTSNFLHWLLFAMRGKTHLVPLTPPRVRLCRLSMVCGVFLRRFGAWQSLLPAVHWRTCSFSRIRSECSGM